MAYTEKTHPLCTSNDGLSAGRPVVRLSVFIRDGEDNGKYIMNKLWKICKTPCCIVFQNSGRLSEAAFRGASERQRSANCIFSRQIGGSILASVGEIHSPEMGGWKWRMSGKQRKSSFRCS